MKKLLLSLGTVGAIAAPVAMVVACGKKETGSNTILNFTQKSTGEIISLDIYLSVGKDEKGTFLDSAKSSLSAAKTKMTDITKVTIHSEKASIRITWGEFKSATTPSSKLEVSAVATDYQLKVYKALQTLAIA